MIGDSSSNTTLKEMYDDVLIFRDSNKSYIAVADMNSGALLWKEPYSSWGEFTTLYYDGVFYFDDSREDRLVSVNLGTGEELWSYHYRKADEENKWVHVTFFDEKILLLTYDIYSPWYKFRTERILDNLVLLDKNGSVLWEYTFAKGTRWESSINSYFEMLEGTIFFVWGEGVIEAFDAETGEKLWANQIKGSWIRDLEVVGERVYMTGNDGRFYCLDVVTGEILWFLQAEKYVGDGGTKLRMTRIGDGIIFVATSSGYLYAFFLDVEQMAQEPFFRI